MVKKFRFEFHEGELAVIEEERKAIAKERVYKMVDRRNIQMTIRAGIVVLILVSFSTLLQAINNLDNKIQETQKTMSVS